MKLPLVLVMVILASLAFGQTRAGGAKLIKLECEVLEISCPAAASTEPLAAIRYALVRQRNPDDSGRLSQWLRTRSGAEVTFTAADGRLHRGILRRLRMCFGRGLLVFAEPVDVKEGETIMIDFSGR